jgi:hypothetical protein
MKEKPLFSINLLLICCTLASCGVLRSAARSNAMINVPLKQLVANPSHYHGKVVCTEGIYLEGFEVSALSVETNNRDGLTYLTEPALWIEGAAIVSRSNCFVQNDNLGPQSFEFCQVTVCGRFEHCRKCGHLDGYKYRLINADISKPRSITLADGSY